ncbi:tachykinin-like peptide [Ambystoma mexicanum]|uniref:tachykinin-like peptide n=1 Tax=Ambystoma mexicanum TaxID=8296 RepID=UPI0037E7BDBD
MKVLAVFAVLILLSTGVFAEQLGLREEADWLNRKPVQSELQTPLLEGILQRLAKHRRQNELFERLAKNNRPKSETYFVLMGKRSPDSESVDWNGEQNIASEYQ